MLATKKGQVVPAEEQESKDQSETSLVKRRGLNRAVSVAAHQAQFHLKGKPAFRALCRLYVQIHTPVAIISAWMCGYYALISFLVTHKLCTDAVRSTPGTTQGYLECIYVTHGDYDTHLVSKVLFLFFWLVQQTWLVGFTALLAYAMMPAWFRLVDKVCIGIILAVTAAVTLVAATVFNKPLNATFFFAVQVPLGFITLMTVAQIVKKFSGDAVNFLRWTLLMLLSAIVVTIYIIVFPRLVTARATANQLLLLRLVFHPLIWNIMTALFSHTARHIGPVPNLMQTCLFIWPYMYNSVYGRFLLLQLAGVGDVLVLNIILSVFDLVSRLNTRYSGYLIMRLMYGVRTAEAMMATRLIKQIRMAEMFAKIISEHAGILCAAAILSCGRVTGVPGVPPDYKNIWLQALVQTVTSLVAEFVCMAAEWKYQGIDHFSCWVRDMRRFIWYLLVIVTIGGSRLCMELLLLFCPSNYEGVGVLLEYCDNPSIFQVIGR